MEANNQTVLWCLVVFAVFLANWEYELFNFAFDWLHLLAIELAIIGFTTQMNNPAAATAAAHVASPSASKGGAAPGSATGVEPGPATATAGSTKTVNVETYEIDPDCKARPSGEFPTHEVYGPLARQLKEEFLTLVGGAAGGWALKFENADVKIESHSSSEKLFKFHFSLANTPLTCFDFLNSVARRQEWDDLVAEARVIEEIDRNTLIYYIKTKAIFPTAARDTVVFSFRTVLPDGRLVNITKSIDHPSTPPDPTGSVIRAESGLSGMICAPVEGNVKKTQVVQISNLDPKGWIPSQVKTLVLTKSLPKSIATVSGKLKAEKPLDLKVVTVTKQVPTAGGGEARIDFAPLLARIKEVEASLATTEKAKPQSAVDQVREALDFVTPFMIGTIYFVVLYQYLVPRRK